MKRNRKRKNNDNLDADFLVVNILRAGKTTGMSYLTHYFTQIFLK